MNEPWSFDLAQRLVTGWDQAIVLRSVIGVAGALILWLAGRALFRRSGPALAAVLWILAGLAAVAEQQGDPAKAAEIFREALALARYDYEKVILMGDLSRALEAGGANDEALKVMDEIVEKFPEHPRTPLIKEHRAELRARMQAGTNG